MKQKWNIFNIILSRLFPVRIILFIRDHQSGSNSQREISKRIARRTKKFFGYTTNQVKSLLALLFVKRKRLWGFLTDVREWANETDSFWIFHHIFKTSPCHLNYVRWLIFDQIFFDEILRRYLISLSRLRLLMKVTLSLRTAKRSNAKCEDISRLLKAYLYK